MSGNGLRTTLGLSAGVQRAPNPNPIPNPNPNPDPNPNPNPNPNPHQVQRVPAAVARGPEEHSGHDRAPDGVDAPGSLPAAERPVEVGLHHYP